MKILLTGGGTAGHINPAIAIAEYATANDNGTEILFVGREGGDENDGVKRAGFELQTVKVKGLERSFSMENLKRIRLAISAVGHAKEIISEFSPDIIVGTGGYVSWPCLAAGISKRIPTVIHESNVSPGLVTKLLATRCDRVLINLDGSREYLKKLDNVVTVGNPLRKGFSDIGKSEARRILGLKAGDFMIASFGGSGGSDKMNEACIGLMKSYSQRSPRVRHLHATGKRYYENYKKNERELCVGKSGCKIVSYIDEMPLILRACDLAIARCGAVTLSEISCVGVPSILVPSPNVTNGHQLKNALYFCEQGAARMIEEEGLSERTLLDTVRRLEGDGKLRQTMSESARRLYVDGSAEKIYNELKAITDRK